MQTEKYICCHFVVGLLLIELNTLYGGTMAIKHVHYVHISTSLYTHIHSENGLHHFASVDKYFLKMQNGQING